MNLKTLKYSIFTSLFLSLLLFFSTGTILAEEGSGLNYQAYGHNHGWYDSVSDSETLGSENSGIALEALEVEYEPGINYRVHLANFGWQDWVESGVVAGTTDTGNQIEAVEITLDDAALADYNVYYRVDVRDVGWLDWAENGETAGSTGLSDPIEAIEITVVKNTEEFDGETESPSLDSSDAQNLGTIRYQAHVSDIGWQGEVSEGNTAGTTGQSKSLEAITVTEGVPENSDLIITTHVQNHGWTNPVVDGEVAGTTGEGLAIEGVKIETTGLLKALEHVYYRVHVHNIGWLDWAEDGALAGTEGLGLPVEAIEIDLVPKGQNPPGETTKSGITRKELEPYTGLTAQGYVENKGWLSPVKSGENLGTEGQGLGIEGLTINFDSLENCDICYNPHIEDIGWQGEKKNGEFAGTTGQNKQLEAIAVYLRGYYAAIFDVYYQAHSEDYGWLGWAKNGEWAGTSGGNRKLEGLRVRLAFKNDNPPGETGGSYVQAPPKRKVYTRDNVDQFELICAIVQHEGGDSYEGALAVMSCVMNRCDSGAWGGTDPVSVLTAPGQFASYLDGYYKQFMGGRTSPVVQQAVLDCLNGKRSHPYQSFRAYRTSGSVNIGGNWFF